MEIHGGEMAKAERMKEIMNYAAELRASGCQVLSVVIVRNPFIHAYSDYYHYYMNQYGNLSSFFNEYVSTPAQCTCTHSARAWFWLKKRASLCLKDLTARKSTSKDRSDRP